MFLFNNATTKIAYNKAWIQVFHQKYQSGSFFTPETVLSHYDEYKFSYLGQLESFRYKGKFEFLLEYPEIPGFNIFTQSSNPTQNYEVQNYHPIKMSFTERFYGLALSNDTESTFIDGNPGGTGNWFYAIGPYISYCQGIPGPSSKTVHEVDLWARIPLREEKTCKQMKTRLIKHVLFVAFALSS